MRKFVFTSSLCLIAFYGISQEQQKLSKASSTELKETPSKEIKPEDQLKIQERRSQKEAAIKKQENQANYVKGSRKSTEKLDDKGRVIITKDHFDKMTPERQKWISNQPDKYIVQ